MKGLSIAKNKGFEIFFNADTQTYTVYRNGEKFVTNKHKFSEVKSYLD